MPHQLGAPQPSQQYPGIPSGRILKRVFKPSAHQSGSPVWGGCGAAAGKQGSEATGEQPRRERSGAGAAPGTALSTQPPTSLRPCRPRMGMANSWVLPAPLRLGHGSSSVSPGVGSALEAPQWPEFPTLLPLNNKSGLRFPM